jgi:hypothetical protein
VNQFGNGRGERSFLRKPLQDHQPDGYRQRENTTVPDDPEILLQRFKEAWGQGLAEPVEDLPLLGSHRR